MDQITVTIPDPTLRAFIDQLVATGRYASGSDYVLELIRDDRARRARVEALVREGLESGESIVMTDEVWEKMDRDFCSRHRQP